MARGNADGTVFQLLLQFEATLVEPTRAELEETISRTLDDVFGLKVGSSVADTDVDDDTRG